MDIQQDIRGRLHLIHLEDVYKRQRKERGTHAKHGTGRSRIILLYYKAVNVYDIMAADDLETDICCFFVKLPCMQMVGMIFRIRSCMCRLRSQQTGSFL